jgi:ATP-binding cassette subfamily C exporter for protease/lipase
MGHWRSVVNAREAFFRMEALLEQHSAEAERMPLPAPAGNVAVENLTVMPPGRSIPTARGLNFKLSAGEVLVVMGPSGSGKTSLARALTGLWPASSGKVRLDGADVFMWNKAELGRHIGYLPQGIELFDGTIAENIARFSSIDELAVQAAVDLSGLSQLLAGLPKGVNTLIGSEGEQISRGQLQRIALARAIYGSPSFVVLDEPNSNLDSLGDTSLLNVVTAKKLEGVTFVLVTHRMDILKAADKVLLLKDGSQAAFGPRDDVLEALRQANQKLNQLRSSGHVAP